MDQLTFLLILCSATIHASWNFYAKKCTANKVALLWAGHLLCGILLLPFTLYWCISSGLTKTAFFFALLSSICHAFYIWSLGKAYEVGELSVVYPIARGLGIAGTALVTISTGLDHQVSLVGITAITIITSGVLLIGTQKFSRKHLEHEFLYSCLVGIGITLYAVVDKLAVVHLMPILVICLYYLGTPIVLYGLLQTTLKHEFLDVLTHHKRTAVGIGIASLIPYVVVLWAFQQGPASYAVALRETSIIFATLLGIYLLNEQSSLRKICAVSLIAFGAILMKGA